MALLDAPQEYHRPSSEVVVDKLVARLAGAPTPPVAKDFHFPMSHRSKAKVVAAINALDTSGQAPLTIKDLHDPWPKKTADKLKRVTI
jgi:hypothetical protein